MKTNNFIYFFIYDKYTKKVLGLKRKEKMQQPILKFLPTFPFTYFCDQIQIYTTFRNPQISNNAAHVLQSYNFQ